MKEISQSFTVSYRYPVCFTRGLFDPGNPLLARVLAGAGEGPHRVLALIDSGLLDAAPDLPGKIMRYAAGCPGVMRMVSEPLPVPGGERCKNDPGETERLHRLAAAHRLCRHSFVMAIGGGAVLDAAGYAAATAHRGLRLVRLPSTVLAQNDAGIGVKNGINAFGRKNFLGTFSPPFAVLNDFDLLATLPPREMRGGIAEAVKVALIADAGFFDFLHRERRRLAAFDPSVMEWMITRCAELHLRHTATSGDPFETGSARPLDFGHWAAHRLEMLTGGMLSHGEAVAVGVALDTVYAHRRGLLDAASAGLVLETLGDINFDLCPEGLRRLDVADALAEFREHLGGELTVTLPSGMGRRVEVHEIDIPLMERCLAGLAPRPSGRGMLLPA